jgi:hypothetical protein
VQGVSRAEQILPHQSESHRLAENVASAEILDYLPFTTPFSTKILAAFLLSPVAKTRSLRNISLECRKKQCE